MELRTHPVTILTNLWRVFYLIIIPVIRGFVYALQGSLANWLQSAWIDVLVLLMMVSFAVLRWARVTYRADQDAFRIRSGIVFRQLTTLPWQRVTTVSMEEGFFLRPFGAATFHLDTMGGQGSKTDVTIYLRRRKARELLNGFKAGEGEGVQRQYVPSNLSILALALLTSNSLVGILFMATFISQSGKLLGNEFSDMLIGAFEEAARTLSLGIPPAAAAIAIALLVGWFIAFILTFIRYKNFAVSRHAHTLRIKGGLFTHRDYRIDYSDINFIEIRQSLITKILNLYSLYISAVGYGKNKDDIRCVIPTEGGRKFTANRQTFFPTFRISERQIRAKSTGIMRFLFEPLIPCIGIPLAAAIFIYFFPNWSGFIWYVGIMSMIPSIFFLTVRCIDFATGGVSFENGCYTISYSRGFSLLRVIVPQEKIALVMFRQGFFQGFGKANNCDLIIQTTAERRIRHKCRNLSKDQLGKLFDIPCEIQKIGY